MSHKIYFGWLTIAPTRVSTTLNFPVDDKSILFALIVLKIDLRIVNDISLL